MEATHEPADFTRIRDEHRVLYRQAQDSVDQIQADPKLRMQLRTQVLQLLSELRRVSDRVSKRNEWKGHTWLRDAADDWQRVFPSVFGEQRDIRSDLHVPATPLTSQLVTRNDVIPYKEILNRIRMTAYNIGLQRKEQVIRARIRELEEVRDDRGRIHSVLASSREERDEDWRLAMVHFAADVLALRTSLAHQLEAQSWLELARVPIEDVKRLDAYYVWEDAPGREPGDCYLDACDRLRTALLDPRSKASAEDLSAFREFMSKGTTEVVRSKAHLRWLARVRHSEAGNEYSDWREAETHVKLFYGNLVAAVEGSQKSTRQALTALGPPWRDRGLVSCLEAAIAIHFFVPKLVEASFDSTSDIL